MIGFLVYIYAVYELYTVIQDNNIQKMRKVNNDKGFCYFDTAISCKLAC